MNVNRVETRKKAFTVLIRVNTKKNNKERKTAKQYYFILIEVERLCLKSFESTVK